MANFSIITLARDAVARMRRQGLAEGFGQLRQQPDRVGDHADVGEIEDGCVLVGVDGDDQICALDPDPIASYSKSKIRGFVRS